MSSSRYGITPGLNLSNAMMESEIGSVNSIHRGAGELQMSLVVPDSFSIFYFKNKAFEF